MVLGYSQRRPWPNPDKFTLCAWFVDSEATQEALKASGIMAKPKPPKRKRAKRKIKQG
jgi:hypothetical protein